MPSQSTILLGHRHRYPRTCEHCGASFFAWDIRRGHGRFCSLRCAGKRIYRTLEDRFWSKVNKDGPIPEYAPGLGSCWLWTAGVDKRGYGQFRVNGKIRPAHQVAYEQQNGPILEGLECDHLCRVHPCVRPSHQEAVTHQENIRRGNWTQRTECINGHAFTPENTNLYKGWRRCRACSRAAWYRRKKKGLGAS